MTYNRQVKTKIIAPSRILYNKANESRAGFKRYSVVHLASRKEFLGAPQAHL
jgi:hypothetical protein